MYLQFLEERERSLTVSQLDEFQEIAVEVGGFHYKSIRL